MRSLVILAVLVFGGVWGVIRHVPVRAEADTGHVRSDSVHSVAIDGRGLPMSALRAVIGTRPGNPVDAAQLEADRVALVDALRARGYLDAVVAPAHVLRDADGGAFVTFRVAQGKLFHVRSITVTGASERDAGVVTIAVGDAALADRIERTREALADRLAARGKPAAVTVKLVTDTAAATVDLELVARG